MSLDAYYIVSEQGYLAAVFSLVHSPLLRVVTDRQRPLP